MSSDSVEGVAGKDTKFPSEVIVHFDGGIRGDMIAYGYVVIDPAKRSDVLFAGSGIAGRGTSNDSEYAGLLEALRACKKRGVKIVRVVSDSQLIVHQINGQWKVKSDSLRQLHRKAIAMLDSFDDWSLKWVRRDLNRLADALVKQAFHERRGAGK